MDATTRPRIWALIEPPDDSAEGDPSAALPTILGDAVAKSGCRLDALMGDDQVLRVLARPKATDPAVVSASVDLFGVTAGPGDDSEGRLRSVRVVVTLADGFEFSAYLMPDEARRVAGHLRVGSTDRA
jgi:hypothetical protein